jgi:hypothetical protein
MASRRAILAYVKAADEDEALGARLRFAGRPGAAGLRASLRGGAALAPPPLLPCEAAEVRALVAQELLAARWPYVTITLAGKAHLGRAERGGVRCRSVAARTG